MRSDALQCNTTLYNAIRRSIQNDMTLRNAIRLCTMQSALDNSIRRLTMPNDALQCEATGDNAIWLSKKRSDKLLCSLTIAREKAQHDRNITLQCLISECRGQQKYKLRHLRSNITWQCELSDKAVRFYTVRNNLKTKFTIQLPCIISHKCCVRIVKYSQEFSKLHNQDFVVIEKEIHYRCVLHIVHTVHWYPLFKCIWKHFP